MSGIRELTADNKDIAGIGCGGQMHGLVALDDRDQVIRPAILWNDGRTQKETDYLNETIGRENLARFTGNIAFAGFTAPKLLWLRAQEPENFRKIRKIMLPKDYINYRLTGIHCTDYSVVTSSQEQKRSRMDIVRALEESLLSFYAVMQEKGIQPEINLPEEPVFRELDAGAVNRIFSNIISNALKYSDGDLSVVMKPDGSITFSNRARNLNAVTVGRLFDRFYTVEASRNSTGLGLSIAKMLTVRMGGCISADYCGGVLCIRIAFPS